MGGGFDLTGIVNKVDFEEPQPWAVRVISVVPSSCSEGVPLNLNVFGSNESQLEEEELRHWSASQPPNVDLESVQV